MAGSSSSKKLLSKKDFADMCGMPTNQLAVFTHPKRGKIIVAESGEIDPDNPINKLFYNNRLAKGKAGAKGVAPQKVVLAEEDKPENVKKQHKKEKKATAKEPEDPIITSKRLLDDAKLKRENLEMERLQIDIDKKNGLLIPVEPVKMLIKQLSKSTLSQFREQIEAFMGEMQVQHSLTNKQVAEMRKEQIDKLNAGIVKAVKETESNLKTIVSEYSEKRGVGERE